jgi:cytochrome P450
MAMDSEFYENPGRFSVSRFCGVSISRTAPTPENPQTSVNYVGTENGNIHWGHGRFTCPGRWYASAVMKIVLAQIITKYDVKFPEDQNERLPNVYLDLIVEPNSKQTVLLKLRR